MPCSTEYDNGYGEEHSHGGCSGGYIATKLAVTVVVTSPQSLQLQRWEHMRCTWHWLEVCMRIHAAFSSHLKLRVCLSPAAVMCPCAGSASPGSRQQQTAAQQTRS